jgi:histidine triad (HIT) family protein
MNTGGDKRYNACTTGSFHLPPIRLNRHNRIWFLVHRSVIRITREQTSLLNMATVFTKIVQGEIPSYKIAENETCFAFLDINPLVKGHTLVIPKKEVDYLFDLDDVLLAELNLFAKKIAKAISAAIPCKRVGMVVLGLEVPHAHIHLIPLNAEGDINFARPKLKLAKEEMEMIATEIRKHLHG